MRSWRGGIGPNYEPNSFHGPKEDPPVREIQYKVSGDVGRYNHRDGNDDYTQPGNLFRLMDKGAQERLIENIAGSRSQAPRNIQERQLVHFYKADPAYGRGVAEGLELKVEDLVLA